MIGHDQDENVNTMATGFWKEKAKKKKNNNKKKIKKWADLKV